MVRTSRSSELRAERRKRVAELTLTDRLSTHRIAAELGVDQKTVANDVRWLIENGVTLPDRIEGRDGRWYPPTGMNQGTLTL